MLTVRTIGAAALMVLAAGRGVGVRGDDFGDTWWRLVVTVYDSSSGQVESTNFTTDPNFPAPSTFQDSHTVAIGDSNAGGNYDFDWASDFGHLLIGASQRAEQTGVPPLGTVGATSSGQIKFTPTQDLAFSISVAYHYQLPFADMIASCTATLRDDQVSDYSFYFSDNHNATSEGPGDDTFGDSRTGVLYAGHPYTLQYLMTSSTSGTAGQVASGSGSINLTFQPTPEPATVALLALGLLAGSRKRHYN
ncbi:MAG TPA: PEP-CTERM sorting domain-containing protein [Phycisphaerae bacterium]|nr:PEP-CTERM sorting domain-containing protein [Phycisphaerae bacterium]